MTPIDLIHTLNLKDIPDAVKEQAKLSILDLIGIGAGGAGTRLSAIIRAHAAQEFGGTIPMLFDGRTASAQGAALAAGMTIDSLDGHDGFNMAKGHIGAPLFPAILALGYEQQIAGREVLLATILYFTWVFCQDFLICLTSQQLISSRFARSQPLFPFLETLGFR